MGAGPTNIMSGRLIRIEIGEREAIGQIRNHLGDRDAFIRGFQVIAKAPDGTDRALAYSEYQFPWSYLGAWSGGEEIEVTYVALAWGSEEEVEPGVFRHRVWGPPPAADQ